MPYINLGLFLQNKLKITILKKNKFGLDIILKNLGKKYFKTYNFIPLIELVGNRDQIG